MDDFIKSMKDTQQSDQVQAAIKQVSSAVSTYYRNLVKAGVPESVAATLASQFQQQVFEMSQRGQR